LSAARRLTADNTGTVFHFVVVTRSPYLLIEMQLYFAFD
jgi:hypothetical protein